MTSEVTAHLTRLCFRIHVTHFWRTFAQDKVYPRDLETIAADVARNYGKLISPTSQEQNDYTLVTQTAKKYGHDAWSKAAETQGGTFTHTLTHADPKDSATPTPKTQDTPSRPTCGPALEELARRHPALIKTRLEGSEMNVDYSGYIGHSPRFTVKFDAVSMLPDEDAHQRDSTPAESARANGGTFRQNNNRGTLAERVHAKLKSSGELSAEHGTVAWKEAVGSVTEGSFLYYREVPYFPFSGVCAEFVDGSSLEYRFIGLRTLPGPTGTILPSCQWEVYENDDSSSGPSRD